MTATTTDPSVWQRLSAALPPRAIEWRQDGKPTARGGQHFARFVPYVTAQYVQERLDEVVPGEWDLTHEVLPTIPDPNGVDGAIEHVCRARLTVLGLHRDGIGQGKDPKAAASDAFKRAAVRFGIARELYEYDPNWVQVESDSRYAKPVEDPGEAYLRKRRNPRAETPVATESPAVQRLRENIAKVEAAATPAASPAASQDEPACPDCGGRMWDNRESKKNPKAPDYKCRSRGCEGVIWPPKPGSNVSAKPAPASKQADPEVFPDALRDDQDDLPF